MAFFTREQFSRIANARAGNKTISNLILESRAEISTGKTTSIFLSHCHTDKDLIGQTVAFLKGLNVSIYIDWLDVSMPEKTSGATAQKIKSKISSNDKFLLLATNSAIASMWCNWKTGIGDTFKLYKNKMVILPLADSRGNWTGNEYLQIYPRVEPYEQYDNIFKVIYPDGSYKWLDDWLKL